MDFVDPALYEWNPWQKGFAWKPRYIDNKWVWLKTFYWRWGTHTEHGMKVGAFILAVQHTTSIFELLKDE